jgi:integrase
MSALALLAPAPARATTHDLAQMAVSTLPSAASRRVYAPHLARYLGSGRALAREQIQAHLNELRTEGRGPSSVNQALQAIKLLAREAMERGLMPESELASILRIKGAARRGTRMGNWLELDALKALLDTAAAGDGDGANGKRNAAIIAVLAGCGLRREELAGLTWDQYVQRGGRWCLLDIKGKGDKLRTVPVPDWVARRIEQWREQAAPGSMFGVGAQAVYYIVRDTATRAGLGTLAPHDLRRTYSKLANEGGAPVQQIQHCMGHSSVQTTEKYMNSQLELKQGRAAGDYISDPDKAQA